MQAYEGYIEGGRFYPIGPSVPDNERRRAFLTVLDEPVRDDSAEKNAHAEAWGEFFREIKDIRGEPLPELERVTFRETEI